MTVENDTVFFSSVLPVSDVAAPFSACSQMADGGAGVGNQRRTSPFDNRPNLTDACKYPFTVSEMKKKIQKHS